MEKLFNQKVERLNSNTYKWDSQTSSDFLPFWVADSDYSTAPSVIDELIKTANLKAFGYNMIPNEFNNAIVEWYKRRYGSFVSPEWIIPSTGVILEIRVLLEILTKENDGIILQTPVYHTFHHLINRMGRRIIENKLVRVNDTYEMNFKDLEDKFKEGHKVMILCSPHNPVGRIWSKDDILKVVSLAKKYNVFLIIDEIHSDLNISNKIFTSGIDFVDLYDNIAVCNAPSKAFNIAGLHTSYIILPNKNIKEEYQQQKDKEFLNSPSVFGYTATIAAYTKGDEYIDLQNKHLLNNYNYLKEFINMYLPNVIVTKLEGTYLVWLDFSYTNLSTCELLDKCKNAKITCNGGVDFCKDCESFLRFNIACPFDQLKEGLNRLVKEFK